MIPDLDMWRAAQLMVKRFGEHAAKQAAMRADKLLAEGDIDGAATVRLYTTCYCCCDVMRYIIEMPIMNVPVRRRLTTAPCFIGNTQPARERSLGERERASGRDNEPRARPAQPGAYWNGRGHGSVAAGPSLVDTMRRAIGKLAMDEIPK